MTDADLAALRAMGLVTDLRALKNENWLAVLKDGAVQTELTGESPLSADYTCGKSSTGTVQSDKGVGVITRNGKTVSPDLDGINIVVFSSSKGRQIDSVVFDTSMPDCPAYR